MSTNHSPIGKPGPVAMAQAGTIQADITGAALNLLKYAHTLGFHVVIRHEPNTPLAMGNHLVVVEVYPTKAARNAV